LVETVKATRRLLSTQITASSVRRARGFNHAFIVFALLDLSLRCLRGSFILFLIVLSVSFAYLMDALNLDKRFILKN